MKTWTEFLGGSDCETCGWNAEEIEIEQEGEDLFSAVFSVGCYGGAATHEPLSLTDLGAWLREGLASDSSSIERLLARVSSGVPDYEDAWTEVAPGVFVAPWGTPPRTS